MDFCQNCGNSLNSNDRFCRSCGAQQREPESQVNQETQASGQQQYSYDWSGGNYNRPPQSQGLNGFAIAGFVLAIIGFFLWPLAVVGLILSCIGLNACKKRGAGGRGLAIAGLVVAIVVLAIMLIVAIFAAVIFSTAASFGMFF